MNKLGFVFPGQGSQKVGMGYDLYQAFPQVKDLFQLADRYCGESISRICFEGPEDILTQTQNAQICIFLVSVSIVELLKKKNLHPQFLAGHSVGELTAYYVAGVFSLEDAISIIRARGKAMSESHSSERSAMAAVMGLAPEDIESVLKPFSQAPLVIANYNSLGQFVISGDRAALEAATPLLKDKGAKRVIPLNVSGAFHSPLMEKASETFSTFLDRYSFQNAQIPIILNRTGLPETDADHLKENLALQIKSSVRWIQSVHYLTQQTDCIIECGYGKVLTGLMKKINPDQPYENILDTESLETYLAKEHHYV